MKHCSSCDCETQLQILREQLKSYQETIASASAKIVIVEAQIFGFEHPIQTHIPAPEPCQDA